MKYSDLFPIELLHRFFIVEQLTVQKFWILVELLILNFWRDLCIWRRIIPEVGCVFVKDYDSLELVFRTFRKSGLSCQAIQLFP